MKDNIRIGLLGDLRVLREAEKENLRLTGGEGSWLTTISILKKFMSPIFKMVEHTTERHEGIGELSDEDFLTMPIEYIVYRNKKNVKAFTKNHSVKMAMEHISIDDTEIVIVMFASYDNPTNPLIIESYFNPYHENDDGEMTFMDDIKVIANSSVQFFGGYVFGPDNIPTLDGMTFVEYTPEFKKRAKEIYADLQANPNKRQTLEQFLSAKKSYQDSVPLNPRKVNWLGDWRKLTIVREFME